MIQIKTNRLILKMANNKIISIFKKGFAKTKSFFKEKKSNFKKAPWYGKLWRTLLYSFILFLLYLFLVDINFLWLFGKSPSISNIKNPEPCVASEIYSEDGVLIGKYFKENRTPVKYEEINPYLVKTLVATEDERFYDHFGIDFSGLFAAVKDYIVHGKVRGASTITQQLVKNMFKTRSQYSKGLFGHIPGLSIIIAKTKEWITAVKIECTYDKQDIITMYLNTVDFGIKTAAKTYFGTTPKDLTIEQCATLVGMLKATTTYNPKINPKNSKRRRNVVLDGLYSHNIITKEECDSLKNIEIDMQKYNVEQSYSGYALYFRQTLADDVEKILNSKTDEDESYDIYSDGLKIYTTIDSRMQKYAEEAAREEMKKIQRNFNSHWGTQEPWRDERGNVIPNFIENLAKRTDKYKNLKAKYNNEDSVWAEMEKAHKVKVFDYEKGYVEKEMSSMDSIRYMERFMHTSLVSMEPTTGFVRAWVGDIDFNFWKYDKVRAERQPGSTFKLFVYAEAMRQGMSPCDYETDSYVQWEYVENNPKDKDYGNTKRWIPHNAEGFCTNNLMTLKAAFARSVNTIAVKVAQEVGVEKIINTAKLMGIKTPLRNTPSTCLGSSDVTLEELVNSYCTVINEGKRHEPVLITRIEDRHGNVIYDYAKEKKEEIPALSYEDAYLMTQMLRAGMSEPEATSMNLWSYVSGTQTDFGGKTGTSSNHSDAWFVAVSPKLVTGSWVGGEHRCIHFRTSAYGSGSRAALPIVGSYLKKVLNDNSLYKYRARFDKPKENISRTYSCQSFYIKNDSTSSDSTSTSTPSDEEEIVAD